MRAIIHYILQDYRRSYLFVPPVTIFILWTFVSYTYTPNPILSSYAISSTVLYFITAWLVITLIKTEDSVQQQITILHARSLSKVLFGKIIAVLLLTITLTIFAISYPILIGAFNRLPTLIEILLVFFSHVLISLLSISIIIFLNGLFRFRSLSSWLLLSLILTMSLAKEGIAKLLPHFFTFLTWPLPPTLTIVDILSGDTINLNMALIKSLGYVIGYIFLLLLIGFILIKKRGFVEK